MDLHQIFDQYVGSEIKDPERWTCDWDEVAAPITAAAAENGLILLFQKVGAPAAAPLANAVHAHIEPAGHDNLWKITSFTPD